ncbi:hypothetical protein Mapa_006488 [Marchantia paleacea]|nr:hypothetical protein Mapa_006488 [Marchantia paleacea]
MKTGDCNFLSCHMYTSGTRSPVGGDTAGWCLWFATSDSSCRSVYGTGNAICKPKAIAWCTKKCPGPIVKKSELLSLSLEP